MADDWTTTAKPGCKLIAWSPTKNETPQPNCPECGGAGELDLFIGVKIGYFHKVVRKQNKPTLTWGGMR